MSNKIKVEVDAIKMVTLRSDLVDIVSSTINMEDSKKLQEVIAFFDDIYETFRINSHTTKGNVA